jgi:hypothetical protein
MFVHAAVTSKLVEQALPLMPYLDDGEQFLTYESLAGWKAQFEEKGGHEPDSPDTWSAPISAPLLPNIVDIGHEQMYEALKSVAFQDSETSPWGRATRELQEWLLLPDDVSGVERKPSDAAAVAVLLTAVYGNKAPFLFSEATRYLGPSGDDAGRG